jgi:hypothetical protein
VIWLTIALGLLVAAFGATAGAALITVSRAELTRIVGRRLRGAAPSLHWLVEVDAQLTAASATTSLGVLILGAALPALLAGSGTRRLVVVLALVGVPLVLLAAYLVPRWLTLPGWCRCCGPGPGCSAWSSRPGRPAVRPTCARSGARAPPSVSEPTTSW